MYPLLFEPNLHTIVWGGHKLQQFKTQQEGVTLHTPVGESWEVSAVESSPSIVANGSLRGRDLISVVQEYGPQLLGESVSRQYGGKLPLLVKFIDAQADLSIQVHPNDELAMARHGKSGKSEMWYVIAAQPGASLYAGFNRHVSHSEYQERVANGTIAQVLARHEVHAGDVFYIPSGRVHAICSGILLAEVQQSSDVTYRIFDYNRPGLDGKPRQLHTELAVDAIDFRVEENYRTLYSNPDDRAIQIIDTPYFDVRVMELTKPMHRNLIKYDSFIISVCIEGSMQITLRNYDGEQNSITVSKGNSCLIPACVANYDVAPLAPGTRILDAYIDRMERSPLSVITRFLHISTPFR